MKIYICSVFGLTLLFSSCREEEIAEKTLLPYLHTFVQEAKKRDMEIDILLHGLEIRIKSDLHTRDGKKVDALYDPNIRTVYIDTATVKWKEQPEEVFAHEMGHALFRRQHDYTMIEGTTIKKSIMGSLASPFFSTPDLQYRRSYYYDELFNPDTPKPTWPN